MEQEWSCREYRWKTGSDPDRTSARSRATCSHLDYDSVQVRPKDRLTLPPAGS